MDDAGLSGPLESGQDAGLEQFSDWLHASMDEHVGDAFSSDLPRSSHMYNEATRIGPESPDVIWSVDNGGTLEREQAASECPTPSLARDSEVATVATPRPQPTVGHGQWQLGELQTTHSLHSGLQIFCCLGRQEFLLKFLGIQLYWSFLCIHGTVLYLLQLPMSCAQLYIM